MALPAVAPFPSPALFPQPQPNPQTFGLSSTDTALVNMVGASLPQPTQIGGTSPSGLVMMRSAALVDQQLGTSLSSAGDPRSWTPQQASDQTDRALARIAQSNPEVAQQLQEQRTGAPPQDGGGVLNFLKQAVGAVSGLPVIHQALDIMSRAGHIVPEILADEEHQSVWGNIAQALAGHSDKQMINVLDKYGILTGDDMLSSVAQSVAGFGLDLLVDPTTYLTMGLGAVGRSVAAKVGAKVGFLGELAAAGEKGAAVLDQAAEKLVSSGLVAAEEVGTEAGRKIAGQELWKASVSVAGDELKTGKIGNLSSALESVTADARPGVMGMALEGEARSTYLKAVQAADSAHSIITSSGLSKLGPKLAEQLGIPLEQVEAVLKGSRVAGHFGSKEAYVEAKVLGALKGGVRFAIPGIRVITPSLIGTASLDFSIARRFVSGLSGQTRLMRLIESGAIDAEEGTRALQAFWKGESTKGLGGFDALREAAPKVAEKLTGSGLVGGLRNANYTLSETLGRGTRAFSTSWQVTRGGGLGAQLASDARKMHGTVVEAAYSEQYALHDGGATEPHILSDATADQDLTKMRAIARPVKKTLKSAAKGGTTRTLPTDMTPSVGKEYTARKVAGAIDAARKAGVENAEEETNNLIVGLAEVFPTEEARKMGADAYFAQKEATLEAKIEADTAAGRMKPQQADSLRTALQAERERALKLEAAAVGNPDAIMASRLIHHFTENGRRLGNDVGARVVGHHLTISSTTAIAPEDVAKAAEGSVDITQNVTFHYLQEGTVSAETGPGIPMGAITNGTAESGGVRGTVFIDEERHATRGAPTWSQPPVYAGTPEDVTAAQAELDAATGAIPERAALSRPIQESFPDGIDWTGGGPTKVESSQDAINVINQLLKTRVNSRVRDDLLNAQALLDAGAEYTGGDLPDLMGVSHEAFIAQVKQNNLVARGVPKSEAAIDAARAKLLKARLASIKLVKGNEFYHVTQEMDAEQVLKYVHPGDWSQAEMDVRDALSGGASPINQDGFKLRQLDQDMRDGKLNEPIVIGYDPKTGKMEILDGHHRLSIARRQGMTNVPVRIQQVATKYFQDGGHAIDFIPKTNPEQLAQLEHIAPSDIFPEGVHTAGPPRDHVLSPRNPVVQDDFHAKGRAMGRNLTTVEGAVNPYELANQQAGDALDQVKSVYADAIKEGARTGKEEIGLTTAQRKWLDEVGIPQPETVTQEQLKSLEAYFTGKKAELVMKDLRSQGFDSFIHITEDGRRIVTMFPTEDGTLPPMWHVTDAVPQSVPEMGLVPKIMTPEARHITGKNAPVDASRRVGRGASSLEKELQTKFAGLSMAEAEVKARQLLKARNIDVPKHIRIFQNDPLMVLDQAANQTAAEVGRNFLGRVSEHLDKMGLTKNPLTGGSATPTYEYVVNVSDEMATHLKQQNEDYWVAAEMAQQTAKRLADEHIGDQMKALADQVTHVKEWMGAHYEHLDYEVAGVEDPVSLMTRRPHVTKLGNTGASAAENDAARASREAAFAAGEDPNYVYHFMPQDRMGGVRVMGLAPSTPADAAIAPNAPYARFGVYFGSTTKEAHGLLPMKSARDAVPLRVARDDAVVDQLLPTGRGGEVLQPTTIPPAAIEYFGADGQWHNIRELTPSEAAGVSGHLGGPDWTTEQVTNRLKRAQQELIGTSGEGPRGELVDPEVPGLYRWQRPTPGAPTPPGLAGVPRSARRKAAEALGDALRHEYRDFRPGDKGYEDMQSILNDVDRWGRGENVDISIVSAAFGEAPEDTLRRIARPGPTARYLQTHPDLAGLPPVPPGHTRVFRGGAADAGRDSAKWWTIDYEEAKLYAEHRTDAAGRDVPHVGNLDTEFTRTESVPGAGGVYWRDVPTSDLEAKLRQMPEEARSLSDLSAQEKRAAERDLGPDATDADIVEHAAEERAMRQDDRTFGASDEAMQQPHEYILSDHPSDIHQMDPGVLAASHGADAVAGSGFMAEAQRRLATEYPAEPIWYYTTTGEGQDMKVTGVRIVDSDGQIVAFTGGQYQRQGIGSRLAHADWKDRGLDTPEAMLAAASAQSLSQKGVLANVGYIKKETAALLKSHQDALDVTTRDLANRQAVVDSAVTEAQKLETRMKTKNFQMQAALGRVEDNAMGMTELNLPGYGPSGLTMPAFMADEFHRAVQGYNSINGFHRVFREFNTWWKKWATYRFPGFHIRNVEGAWFNNWLGGVSIRDHIESGRMLKARDELAHGVKGKWASTPLSRDFMAAHGLDSYFGGLKGGPPTYGDLQQLAASVGITSAHGRAFMEARVTAEDLEARMKSRKNIYERAYGPVGAAWEKGGRKAGDVTESLFRQAAFLKGLRDSGGDLMQARMFTMMRHGDYADLTDFEYEKVRDLIPFYKWTRTNLPLQIHQLFESPGKITGFLHAKDAAWNATGSNFETEQYKMPGWMREGFSFPFKLPGSDVKQLVMLDLPFNDLYASMNEYVSQFLPLVRPLFESYVVDKTLFSGKPLTGAPVHVGWMDHIPLVPSLLSSLNVGEIGPDGKYYLDDKMQNVLSAVPMFSRAKDWIYDDPARNQLRANTFASAIFGMGVRPFGEDQLTSEELNFYYSQIEPTLAYMKGIGYQLPTTSDIEAAYGTAGNALLSAGITPGGPAALATAGATSY